MFDASSGVGWPIDRSLLCSGADAAFDPLAAAGFFLLSLGHIDATGSALSQSIQRRTCS